MEKREIVLIGTGGMAREVRWVIEELNKIKDQWHIAGWVSQETPGTEVAGLPVLGNDEWLLASDSPINVAVSVGNGSLRKKIVERLKQNPKIYFPSIIAPSADISKRVKFGKGAIIMNKSVMTVDIQAGDFFLCNYGCTVGHDCIFGNYVTLNPGARISGAVHIKEGTTVGVGASIIQGIEVGSNSFIGAGAVVIRNVENNCTVAGVPSKPIKKDQ